MIPLDLALAIYRLLLSRYGGLEGIRDQDALDAALSRPYATFDNQELYKTAEEKASAIMESIVKNHPFLDGNKRMGYVLMRLILMQNGRDIKASEDEKYEFVIKIASGELDYAGILVWITNHLVDKGT